MKAYTDIEQSKKLAEILPLESADMVYAYSYSVNEHTTYPYPLSSSKHFDVYKDDIPCWSLAALLSILHDYTLQTNSDGGVFVVCDSKKPMISDNYRNPVDACVDMILLLKERSLI